MTTPILLSWSGGKDSSLVLAALRSDPRFNVVALLTSYSIDDRRISGHGIPLELIEAQADALGLPLISASLPSTPTNAAYEAAMAAAIDEARAIWPGLRHIAYGDLFLEDIRAFREQLAERAGVKALFPLWGRPTRALADAFIEAEFCARVVSVDTTRLDASFLGRDFDGQFLRDLPAHVDPCGENGEFHTFVCDGPVFSRRVRVAIGATRLDDGRFARCNLQVEASV